MISLAYEYANGWDCLKNGSTQERSRFADSVLHLLRGRQQTKSLGSSCTVIPLLSCAVESFGKGETIESDRVDHVEPEGTNYKGSPQSPIFEEPEMLEQFKKNISADAICWCPQNKQLSTHPLKADTEYLFEPANKC